MKYGEEKRYEAAAHAFMLGSELESLGVGGSQEDFLGRPFTYKVGHFRSDMQTMPYAAQVV